MRTLIKPQCRDQFDELERTERDEIYEQMELADEGQEEMYFIMKTGGRFFGYISVGYSVFLEDFNIN